LGTQPVWQKSLDPGINKAPAANNFSAAVKDDFSLTTLASTPIPESRPGVPSDDTTSISPVDKNQDKNRDKNQDNIIAQRGPISGTVFATVQLAEQFKTGIQDRSPAVQKGIDLLFEQIPLSSGLPLFVYSLHRVVNLVTDMTVIKHKVFQSYGDYDLLKQNYPSMIPPGSTWRTRQVLVACNSPIPAPVKRGRNFRTRSPRYR